jgi:hypothetical protein
MAASPEPSSRHVARQVATSLRLVRIAFTGAVVGFAVLAQQRLRSAGPESLGDPGALRWVNAAFLVLAAAALLVLQRRHAREEDPRRRHGLNVLAWAAGESAALLGVVHWMRIGNPLPFYLGLAVLLAAFVLVPIRE